MNNIVDTKNIFRFGCFVPVGADQKYDICVLYDLPFIYRQRFNVLSNQYILLLMVAKYTNLLISVTYKE